VSLAGFVAPDTANPKVRQLLDGAHRLFLEQGYDSVSTDAIAREARVSKATLYAYFPSKEALFATLVGEQCGQRSLAIWSAAATNSGVEDVLRTIARNFMAMFATSDALAFYRTIIAQVPRFPELGRVFYESGPKLLQDRIEEFLRAASDRGELSIPDAGLAAMQFIQLVSADLPLTGLLALEPLTEERIERTVESGITLFLRGYARPLDD
jgi:AcrR family transcriptional regulator